jgi:hypothetical protein
MRCLSPAARYSIQVFEGRESVVLDARGYASTHALEKPVIANFTTSGLLDHEIEVALENFSFSGLPEGVSPLAKVSVFDTDAFCSQYPDETRDEMQIAMENRLRVLQEQFGGFIIVDQPAAEKPWNSYDDNTPDEVLRIQQATGAYPEKVRIYEEENENRTEIVAAMLRLTDPEGAEALYGPPEGDVAEVGVTPDPEKEKEAFTVES